jgi:ATP-binding cassette subfamily B protein RaxB
MHLDLGLFSRKRIRLVRQTEISECGLACLAMIAGYHGLNVDMITLRREFEPSTRGATLKWLIACGDRIGLICRPLKLPLEDLASLHLPAILHWNMNHFVIIERVKGERALIHNTDGQSRWYDMREVSDHFTGIALELRPGDDFEPAESRRRLRLSQLWQRITGIKRALLQTLVLSLVLQAFVLTSPLYMQIAIDRALPALDGNLLAVLALGFGLFTLFNVTASLLRSFVLLSAGTSLSFGISINIARRLFRLPIDWFERRDIGDVLSRFQSITPIKQALTEGTVGALLDGVLALATLVVLFLYSVTLALLAASAFLAYVIVRLVSFSFERRAREAAIIASAKEQSTMIESLRGITTLRLSNREAMRHSLWQSRLTDAINADLGHQRVAIWQSTLSALIFGTETIASIWLALHLVMAGGFSIGMVFAYFAFKTQFHTKATPLIDQIMAFRMLGLHLERLSDIALSDQDISFTTDSSSDAPLGGRIELRQVSFQYSPTEPLVLSGINLVIEAGEHVAITGPSGAGKSTLVKIVVGLLEPKAGEVLVDGMPVERFGYRNYHGQIAAVLQEDHLFTGSLAENIALFDDSPDIDRIAAAAKAAAIHEDITAMPMGYETFIGDMGSTLSGGQKQRVLLARALYREPRFLILDEGTSHLDPERESIINEGIRKMGITRLIIAHRSESLISADRVFVLEDGGLRETTPVKIRVQRDSRMSGL